MFRIAISVGISRQIGSQEEGGREGLKNNNKIKGDYMASKMNVAYVETDSAEEHLIVIRSHKIITADMVDSYRMVKCMVHQSSSHYGGIRSAITHVYFLTRLQMPEIMKRELSTFIAGMERKVIAEKKILVIRITEGENPSASIHMRSLRRHYLKVEKRGIFLHIYSCFSIVSS